MDRRPDPTDELYDFAREAYACADYEQAVYFLRKASSLAPMRQDIRQFLAEVLARSGETSAEKSGVGAPGSTADRPAPIEIVQAPIPQEQLPAKAESRASTASSFFQLPLRRLMERLPVRQLFGAAAEEAEEKDEEPAPLPGTARIEPIRVSPPSIIDACTPSPEPEPPLDSFDTTPGEDVVRMSLSHPSPRSEFASSRRNRDKLSETDEMDSPSRSTPSAEPARIPNWDSAAEDDAATPAPVARRERPRRPRSAPAPEPVSESTSDSVAVEEAAEESAVGTADSERGTTADWLASLPTPSRRTVVFGCAYGAVAVFVVVASTQCYRKFFRGTPPTASAMVAEAAPSNAVQTAAPASVASVVEPRRNDTADRIRSLLGQGQLDKAAELFRTQAAQLGNDESAVRMELAHAFDRMGTEYLTRSHFAPAIEHYTKAVALAPSHAGYAVHLGNAHYHAARDAVRKSKNSAAREELQKAQKVLLRALEIDSRSIEACHRLATVYQQLGNETEAVSYWTRALAVLKQSLQADGPLVETYQRIAMVAGCLGRTSEQREALHAILKLAEPGSPAAISAQKELKSLEKSK